MLHESGAPPSFWGEALSSFINVSKRFTTAALQGVTSHEAFLGAKQDLSCLCVWGCTAYLCLLIQRDKHPLGSLGVHMEKCILIEYPQGYKGWKFYNPQTKKTVISEHANFDERFFMLQRHWIPQLLPPPPDSSDSLLGDKLHLWDGERWGSRCFLDWLWTLSRDPCTITHMMTEMTHRLTDSLIVRLLIADWYQSAYWWTYQLPYQAIIRTISHTGSNLYI